jgi:NAD(P)-dependent dehydrogenase (short-subunit alcohol dehydrogenase family)
LDILINNAGNDRRHAIEEVTPELWDQLMAVNLRQQFFVTQSALPALRQSGNGNILNMSSIAWIIPSVGLPVYVAAKAAIVGLTRTLAREVGRDNIRVNAILPGAILTEKQRQLVMTPEYSAQVMASQSLKRHLLPEEIARLALFLTSDDASAITGQSHIADGGWV